jgi:hypothetical protein
MQEVCSYSVGPVVLQCTSNGTQGAPCHVAPAWVVRSLELVCPVCSIPTPGGLMTGYPATLYPSSSTAMVGLPCY